MVRVSSAALSMNLSATLTTSHCLQLPKALNHHTLTKPSPPILLIPHHPIISMSQPRTPQTPTLPPQYHLICHFPSGRQEFISDNTPSAWRHVKKKKKKKKKKKVGVGGEQGGGQMQQGGQQIGVQQSAEIAQQQRDTERKSENAEKAQQPMNAGSSGGSSKASTSSTTASTTASTNSTTTPTTTAPKKKKKSRASTPSLAIVTSSPPISITPSTLSPLTNVTLSLPNASSPLTVAHNQTQSVSNQSASPVSASSTSSNRKKRRQPASQSSNPTSNTTSNASSPALQTPPESPMVPSQPPRHITSYYTTNIHSFFKHTTPKLPSSGPYSLADSLWPFFDEPYGIEVPVLLNGERDNVYFVPHLSGYYLEIKASQNDLPETPTKAPDSPQTPNSSTTLHREKNSHRRMYYHFEAKNPSERNYLTDEIQELAQTHPILLSSSEQLSESSFFSILWVPIMCHNSTVMFLNGEILCFYSFKSEKEFVLGMKNEEEVEGGCGGEGDVANRGGSASGSGSATSSTASSASQAQTTPNPTASQAQTTPTPNSQPTPSTAPIPTTTDSTQYYAPLIGFAPYKVRNETWFKGPDPTDSQCSAPLHLIAAVPRIVARLDHLPKAHRVHHDYEHIKTNFMLVRGDMRGGGESSASKR